ncbi:MAG: hypothetical protein AAGB15_15495, partial [Pseudomonadota bacterium]
MALLLCVAVTGPGATAEAADEQAEKAAALEERAREAVETLGALVAARDDLRVEIKRLAAQAEVATEAEKAEITQAIEDQRAQLAEMEQQISVLATGVTEDDFTKREPAMFDLQGELEALVQPFVVMMRNATEEARQIEATRRALAAAQDRLVTTRAALETLSAVQKAA